MAKTLLDLAREAVALAPKCQCGAIATKRYTDRKRELQLCGHCCGMRCMAMVDTLLGETYALSDIPEGKRALEIARAYGIKTGGVVEVTR